MKELSVEEAKAAMIDPVMEVFQNAQLAWESSPEWRAYRQLEEMNAMLRGLGVVVREAHYHAMLRGLGVVVSEDHPDRSDEEIIPVAAEPVNSLNGPRLAPIKESSPNIIRGGLGVRK